MASLLRPADIGQDELDNALVRQKDIIIAMVNLGETIGAQDMLNVLRELWEVCGYSYKTKEIEQRIAQKISEKRLASDRIAR